MYVDNKFCSCQEFSVNIKELKVGRIQNVARLTGCKTLKAEMSNHAFTSISVDDYYHEMTLRQQEETLLIGKAI